MPATYRYEIAKTGRAQCQVQACKNNGDKIPKGDLRFGSLVTFKEHDTWKWKHWGCVTPAQIATIVDQIGGLDGLDIDKDLDILDGYDELPDWAQDKVKYALKNGHVHDEDWKGDPELNVPGARGLHKRTPKKAKKNVDDEQQDSDDHDISPVPKGNKRGRKKAIKDENEEEEQPKKRVSRKRKANPVEDEGEDEIEKPEPNPKRNAKKAKTVVKDENDDEQPLDDDPKPASKRGKKTSGKAAEGGNDESAKDKTQAKASRGRPSRKDKDGSGVKDNEASPQPTSKPSRARGKKVKEEDEGEVADTSGDEAGIVEAGKPSRSRNTKKAKELLAANAESDQAGSDEEPVPKLKKGRGRPKRKA